VAHWLPGVEPGRGRFPGARLCWACSAMQRPRGCMACVASICVILLHCIALLPRDCAVHDPSRCTARLEHAHDAASKRALMGKQAQQHLLPVWQGSIDDVRSRGRLWLFAGAHTLPASSKSFRWRLPLSSFCHSCASSVYVCVAAGSIRSYQEPQCCAVKQGEKCSASGLVAGTVSVTCEPWRQHTALQQLGHS
jgi:hypothetical protein